MRPAALRNLILALLVILSTPWGGLAQDLQPLSISMVRGAFNSRVGKSIIAFYATAHGKVSRVVSRFKPGTVVTTPRMETHFLVTEYGVANFMGKSTRERALDVISLAHPRFPDEY